MPSYVQLFTRPHPQRRYYAPGNPIPTELLSKYSFENNNNDNNETNNNNNENNNVPTGTRSPIQVPSDKKSDLRYSAESSASLKNTKSFKNKKSENENDLNDSFDLFASLPSINLPGIGSKTLISEIKQTERELQFTREYDQILSPCYLSPEQLLSLNNV